MRTIADTFLDKTIEKKMEQPYNKAIDILDYVSNQGKTEEKENTLLTDGPTRQGKLVFEINETLDKQTTFILKCDITTEEPPGILKINTTGKIVSQIPTEDDGEGHGAYGKYYINNIFPGKREKMKRKGEEIFNGINNLLKRLS